MDVLKNLADKISGFFKKEDNRNDNRVWFSKDKDGQWWFLGIYSNKYMDRDGEIIPESAHKEYIEWLKETGFKPMITVFHQPTMPQGFWGLIFDKFGGDGQKLNQIVQSVYRDFGFAQAERVTYLNGFTFVSAKVLPGKEKIAERLSKKNDLGMSHGFIVPEVNGIYLNKYRSFEMSALPSKRAANLLTRSRLQKGDKMKQQQKGLAESDRSFLVDIFGEDSISALESNAEGSEKILDTLLAHKSAISKGSAEETPPEPEKEKAEMPMMEEEDEEDEKADTSTEDSSLKELANEVGEALKAVHGALVELQSKVSALEEENKALKQEVEKKADAEALKALKKDEDEKIAEAFLPRFDWRGGYNASMAKDNVIDKETKDKVLEGAPGGVLDNGKDDFMKSVFWNQILSGGSK